MGFSGAGISDKKPEDEASASVGMCTMPLSESQYVFGNSLYNHSGGPGTNVAVWLDLLAETASNTVAVNGEFGFLRNFADRPEPISQWGWSGVDSLLPEGTSFSSVDFDSILIVPANFIQEFAPTDDYWDEARSPLEATVDLVGDMQISQPNAKIRIYEGWADMGPYAPVFPPDAASLAAFHAFNIGAYHDWYVQYTGLLQAAFPSADIELIPVARILSQVLTGPLAGIPVTDLYTDNAPHGTDTVYFLAAMIVYEAQFGVAPPVLPSFPAELHPDVATYYTQVLQTISAGLGTPAPSGDETLTGTSGADTLSGGDGNDLIEGGQGNDSLDGGDDDDTIFTGDQNGNTNGLDTATGGAGNDVITGSNGRDSIDGGIGNDTISGGNDLNTADRDTLIGGEGNDLITSGQVTPLASTLASGDVMLGDAGHDTLIGGAAQDSMEGGQGDDSLDGGDADDVIYTGDMNGNTFGEDTAFGGAGNDVITGSNGRDSIDGGIGNDTIYGGNDLNTADRDTLIGGEGNDLITSGQVTPLASTLANGDLLLGDAGHDTLIGGAAQDTLQGGFGNDSLEGGDADDIIFTGADTSNLFGHDTANGGAGNDVITGSNGRDSIDGGIGNDTISGGDDLATADRDTLNGGEGDDLITSGQSAPLAAYRAFGDVMNGDAGNDTLTGGAAQDTMTGGFGDDLLDGGDDDDVIFTGDVNGNTFGVDTALGGAGNDVITGSNGRDSIDGGTGNDTISGGNDLATADRDTLIGGEGDDLITSDQAAPASGYVTFGDDLSGGIGQDTLVGGGAQDTLNGGQDNDTLTGGAAADMFVFVDALGTDHITDFEVGLDRVDLTGLNTAGGVVVAQNGLDVNISVDGALTVVLENLDSLLIQQGDILT